MNNKSKLIYLAQSGMIAALYTVATPVLAPISFASIQFRASEALTILPIFTVTSIPGLTFGCIISNAVGVATGANIAGWIDVILGSIATLMAAICTRMLRNVEIMGIPFLSLLPPVIFNAFIVGSELAIVCKLPFWICALEVGAGELGVMLILGIPLIFALRRTNYFKNGSFKAEK